MKGMKALMEKDCNVGKQGYWKELGGFSDQVVGHIDIDKCSLCGRRGLHYEDDFLKFCPHCGAKMKKSVVIDFGHAELTIGGETIFEGDLE